MFLRAPFRSTHALLEPFDLRCVERVAVAGACMRRAHRWPNDPVDVPQVVHHQLDTVLLRRRKRGAGSDGPQTALQRQDPQFRLRVQADIGQELPFRKRKQRVLVGQIEKLVEMSAHILTSEVGNASQMSFRF